MGSNPTSTAVAHTWYTFLMVRDTQRKGDIALTKAIATFTELGYDVSLPITESAEYDMVLDTGIELVRVQCKFVSSKSGTVDLRKIHSNSKGYVVKSYSQSAYDWLYVYSPDRGEYLIKEFVQTQTKALSDSWKLQPTDGDGSTLEK